ncbi:hypothetical protein [Streptomyces sp. NBC_01615]|uniref:hypothetical protein n=1 Tax=Streptomyces sp. NBC_01615 TaxID=2975898 RepID=UPI00386DA755
MAEPTVRRGVIGSDADRVDAEQPGAVERQLCLVIAGAYGGSFELVVVAEPGVGAGDLSGQAHSGVSSRAAKARPRVAASSASKGRLS